MKPKLPIRSVCLSLLFLAGTVALHATQLGDFTCESSGTEITITGYTGPGGDVVIPDTIAGRPVTSIGDELLCGCTSLSGVTIGSGLTSRVPGAFHGCYKLTSIYISALNPAYSSFGGACSIRTRRCSSFVPGDEARSRFLQV